MSSENIGESKGYQAINVYTSYQDKNRDRSQTLHVTEDTTVEDVIIQLCQNMKISPIAVPLFGLKNLLGGPNVWLSPSHKILSDTVKKHYEFGIRIKVPDVNRLSKIDANAYNFYFKQARTSILNDKIRDIDFRQHSSVIIGFGVCDMLRAMLDDGLTKEQVIKNFKHYLPKKVRRKHWYFLKKPVVMNFEFIRQQKHDSMFLKKQYMESFEKIAPNYLIEYFDVKKVLKDGEKKIVVRVNPFDADMPGISMQEQLSNKWEHICEIEEMCYINTKQDGGVEISRKNGIPVYLKFEMMTDMISFVTLLDTYYRLICKWTFNLCNDYPTPSLRKLFRLKCHGPISGEFSYRKLAEKRNNKPGNFILRQSDQDYNSYYIDFCPPALISTSPRTVKIVKNIDNSYRLNGENKSYPSIPELIKDHRSESDIYSFLYYLPPSEYDKSNLLLCRLNDEDSQPQDPLEELSKNMPVCINVSALSMFENEPQPGQSSLATVYPGSWNSNTLARNVAIKKLNANHEQTLLNEFLHLTSRWAFIKSSSVVKLLGITLANPVSMVMENLPLGPLNLYLACPKNRHLLTENTLVEAATYVANALYHLADKKFIHGRIRCRKLLVANHTESSFVVKLADPGLDVEYTDFDLHWVPPEHHNQPKAARETISSDVWAFATTLWEIFSYGALPAEQNGDEIKKFYSSKKLLPLPAACPKLVYSLMVDCWSYDPQVRKTPQGIMRDINQIFYQVYNSRLINPYTAILPTYKSDGDNISDNSNYSARSKKSENYKCNKRSVVSQLTLRTDLDVEENPPIEISPVILGDTDYQTSNVFDIQNSRIENLNYGSLDENGLHNFEDAFNSVTSMQSIFELDKEWNLVLKGMIGQGYYGQVFRGELHHLYDEKEPQKVAVKKLKIGASNASKQAELDEEIKTMLKLDHPNIVKIIGRIQEPELNLVLEYLEHGSLKVYLNIHKEELTSHILLKYALDIAQGMAYLHDKKYVHRDLAARNILVSDYSVKISDFGLARFLGGNGYYYYRQLLRELPIRWYAPESIQHEKFSFQSDVWSYGVTLFEMFSYGADPLLPDVGTTADEVCAALNKNIRLPMPSTCPQYIYTKIMVPCWKYESYLRPSFRELCGTIEEILNVQQF